eukprot:TRINITY_DN10363_c0_g2_i1.p1 TRINITY_DN10363_c0_g2~~TRINITY_DN10363_c0_g2_i1.p1  ORF type:complete len:532 (+),score=51.37 TRINITY_DN10363_c0_g2_i1:292-1887(+)
MSTESSLYREPGFESCFAQRELSVDLTGERSDILSYRPSNAAENLTLKSSNSEHTAMKVEKGSRLALFLGWCGFAAALVLSLLRVLNVVTLTWATVVVLGAFAPNIPLDQFQVVSALLLLEGARLSLSGYSSLLFTRHVVTYTDGAKQRAQRKGDLQVTIGRVLGLSLTLLLMLCGMAALGVSIWQLSNLEITVKALNIEVRDNLGFGLRVFYWLALMGAVAFLLLYSFMQIVFDLYFTLKQVPLMWRKYFYHMFELCLQERLAAPSNSSFLEFGIHVQSIDHERGVTAGQIYEEQHKAFVSFLADVRGSPELLCYYLNCGTPSEKVAAANLLGFLPFRHRCVDVQVLTSLAAGIGLGPIGRGVANSLAFIFSEEGKSPMLLSNEEFGDFSRRLIHCINGQARDPSWVKCCYWMMRALQPGDNDVGGEGERAQRYMHLKLTASTKGEALAGQVFSNTQGFLRKKLWAAALLGLLGSWQKTDGQLRSWQMTDMRAFLSGISNNESEYMQQEDKDLYKTLCRENAMEGVFITA